MTLILPPAAPANDTEAPPSAAEAETSEQAPAPAKTVPLPPAPQAGNLVPSPPPIAMASLARYIRGAGFKCDEVTASSRLGRSGIYRFDCAAGGSYQGTMKQGHLYFRPWKGEPAPSAG